MDAMVGAAEKLINSMGGRFSTELGIELSGLAPEQIFRWFLAAKLFGARISTRIAERTYREFEAKGITSPQRILETGWDGLVEILDRGGYVRYDFSTATKLLEIMRDLVWDYGGNLNNLHQAALDERDLERRLKALGKGIGDVTVNIFLRELRGVWANAKPAPSSLAEIAGRNLGFIEEGKDPLMVLQKTWSSQKVSSKDFTDFEAALVRLGKDYCKKSKCHLCPMREDCTGYREVTAKGAKRG